MKKFFLLFLKPREHNFFENISTFLPNWNIFFFVVENFRGTNFARKRDELVWCIVFRYIPKSEFWYQVSHSEPGELCSLKPEISVFYARRTGSPSLSIYPVRSHAYP